MRGSLYWITKAAEEKSGSALLKATAWHHRGDSVSTIVALIGVGKISYAYIAQPEFTRYTFRSL
jgi:divalent metal cation (Fe/Co/Zn/Cd) transporter